jgi:hypothetical protein
MIDRIERPVPSTPCASQCPLNGVGASYTSEAAKVCRMSKSELEWFTENGNTAPALKVEVSSNE